MGAASFQLELENHFKGFSSQSILFLLFLHSSSFPVHPIKLSCPTEKKISCFIYMTKISLSLFPPSFSLSLLHTLKQQQTYKFTQIIFVTLSLSHFRSFTHTFTRTFTWRIFHPHMQTFTSHLLSLSILTN